MNSPLKEDVLLAFSPCQAIDEQIVELALLLPRSQAAMLEAAAHGHGMSTAQMLRRLIQEYFARFAQPRPA